ncbi:MAG: glycosyltransferase WbuB [Desulfobacteraceae bacterium]|nr:MAG: glycosyltransferase WbuB [Desulfobacteraceae bacterium]
MNRTTKIKVLIIVENLPVPFDTRVWKEAITLTKNGYEVFVICPMGKGFEKKFEILEGVRIYRHILPKEGNGAVGYLLEYFSAFCWEFFLSLKVFFKHRFHIIQGCNPPDNIFIIALFFKIFGVKYIFDHHDVNPELYYAKFHRKDALYKIQVWLEKMTFRFCDVAMSTNQTYKDIAISRGGMDPDHVFVVRNGPDLNIFKPVRPIIGLKHNKRYLVGYVGTMSIQEGLDILLEVALYIKQLRRTDIHFTCIGGGPGLEELIDLKNKMGLQDMVNFTGRIPDRELLEILSTADVCVNPDRPNEMNNISTMIKIMEYMALRKPIVQFDLKEGRFSAQDASLYAENGSIISFAEKIIWLLDNPEERIKMGDIGLKRVNDHLSWSHSVPNLLLAYSDVVKVLKHQAF